MNKDEAKKILAEELNKLKKKSYAELCKMIDNAKAKETIAGSKKKYYLETELFWDDSKHVNLRVIISIHDGGWRAYFPLTDDFIIDPNNCYVGE